MIADDLPVPAVFARQLATRPHLRTRPLPFGFPSAEIELLWPRVKDDDAAVAFVPELTATLVGGGTRCSARVAKASGGLLIDYNSASEPIGIEIAAPETVSLTDGAVEVCGRSRWLAGGCWRLPRATFSLRD